MSPPFHLSVLDHGYVKFVEDWGRGTHGSPEAGIIEAARQSTQGAFRGWDSDQKLLEYLYRNAHSTPFECCGMTIEVQAPIFVFREWHRHRTQSYSEMSARYAPMPDLYYIPTVERVLLDQGRANKQAASVKGSAELDEAGASAYIRRLSARYTQCEDDYQTALRDGVPKELARCIMPVGHYSRMRATANLRNWLAFLILRLDPSAQWEIRQYASAVGQIVEERFPRTWALFQEGRAA